MRRSPVRERRSRNGNLRPSRACNWRGAARAGPPSSPSGFSAACPSRHCAGSKPARRAVISRRSITALRHPASGYPMNKPLHFPTAVSRIVPPWRDPSRAAHPAGGAPLRPHRPSGMDDLNGQAMGGRDVRLPKLDGKDTGFGVGHRRPRGSDLGRALDRHGVDSADAEVPRPRPPLPRRRGHPFCQHHLGGNHVPHGPLMDPPPPLIPAVPRRTGSRRSQTPPSTGRGSTARTCPRARTSGSWGGSRPR